MSTHEEPTNEERLETLKAIHAAGVSPTSALSHLTNDVKLFHLLFGHPTPATPVVQPPELVDRRAAWIRSEVQELQDAATLYEQADAYLDIIYFAIGGLVEMGIKFTHRLWRLVQAANLAKVWPDGSVRKDSRGKVIKPDGWVAPDAAIASAIDDEINGGSAEDLGTETLINSAADEVVQRMSIAMGGHVHVLLFAVAPDGMVMSASNLSLDNQRDFLRYIHHSLSVGNVLVETERMAKQ